MIEMTPTERAFVAAATTPADRQRRQALVETLAAMVADGEMERVGDRYRRPE